MATTPPPAAARRPARRARPPRRARGAPRWGQVASFSPRIPRQAVQALSWDIEGIVSGAGRRCQCYARAMAEVRRRLDLLREAERPYYVVWELTLACDQPCTHCGSRAGSRRP